MGWTTGYSSDSWQSISVLQEIRHAIWERSLVGTMSDGVPPTPIAVGTNIQTAAFWSDLQSQVEGLVTRFIKQTFVLAGTSGTLDPGYGVRYPYESAHWLGWGDYLAGSAMPGWTRKHRREITSLTQILQDTEGNILQNGHRAVCTAIGTSFPNPATPLTAPTYGPPVYQFNGTAWVSMEDWADGPDYLDCEAGIERGVIGTAVSGFISSRVTDSDGRPAVVGWRAKNADGKIYQYGGSGTWGVLNPATNPVADRVPTGSGCIAGRCKAGDDIGPWIIGDLVSVMKSLGNRSIGGAGFINPTGSAARMTVASSDAGLSSAGAAVSQASGLWTPDFASSTGGSTPQTGAGHYWQAYTTVVRTGATYQANLVRSTLYTEASNARHIAKAFDFFFLARPPVDAVESSTNIYSPQGVGPPSPNVWAALGSTVSVPAGTFGTGSFLISSPAMTAPTDAPSSVPVNDQASKGFLVNDARTIVTWGFAYPP